MCASLVQIGDFLVDFVRSSDGSRAAAPHQRVLKASFPTIGGIAAAAV